MNFRELPLKYSYDSGFDDILWDFYIPVLSEAISYDRIAGFFSSSALALSARGLEQFIINGGKMRLVTCPHLSSKDIEQLENSTKNIDELLTDSFITDYSQIQTQFQKDHVHALGWMLAHDKLEIKIAVIKKNGHICSKEQIESLGIMHQKVGILRDRKDNIITFSGSNNESASGWLGNTEEFKVFSDWTGARPYVDEDIKKFESFWYEGRPDVEVKSIPTAVKEHLFKVSKDFESSYISSKYFYSGREKKEKQVLSLFTYQKIAVQQWKDNNRVILLQMATGCGKTRTSIGCIEIALKDTSKLLVVIACPQTTLSAQWKKDIDSLQLPEHRSIEINGDIPKWNTLLETELTKLSVGRYKNLLVYTTHQICSSEKFISIIEKVQNKITPFLVGDEVHGLGAAETRKGLLDFYKYRLGLSATPDRWFDDNGTNLIKNYFDNRNFEFSIHDALTNINPLTGKTFLVNYSYFPRFISLTDEEILDYQKKTERLKKLLTYSNDDESLNDTIQNLRFQRANIEKNAENKYEALNNILNGLGNDIEDTIIFVSDTQITKVMSILAERNIKASKFTQEQGTQKLPKYNGLSEREYIIDLFKKKKIQVLVAIKCLDEGIDIPSADTAIVMASSTNPREYIQRIGRVIRQAPGKYKARIYDLILKPQLSVDFDHDLRKLEIQIFRKEMDRVKELSENSINNASVINEIYNVLDGVNQ